MERGGTKLWVGNLPNDTDERELVRFLALSAVRLHGRRSSEVVEGLWLQRTFFKRYGLVNDVWVARKPPGCVKYKYWFIPL